MANQLEDPIQALQVDSPQGGNDDDSSQEGENQNQSGQGNQDQSMAELKARLEALERQNTTLQQMAFQRQQGGGQQAQEPSQPSPPELDLSDLPNPADSPEEYNRKLNEKLTDFNRKNQEFVQAQTQAAQQASQSSDQHTQRAAALWEDFRKKHPGLAQNETIVGAAAEKVAQRLNQRGVDVNQYMTAAEDQFFDEVVNEARSLFPNEVQALESGGQQTGEKSQDDPQRTAGIPGGQESGGGTSAGGQPANEELGSLAEDLTKEQEKMGLL